MFRTMTGMIVGMVTTMAACVVGCGDCRVATLAATLAFKEGEAVKPTCEDPRRLLSVSRCQTLGGGEFRNTAYP
jgi:hypothetical protein